jgi:hypothetical protein
LAITGISDEDYHQVRYVKADGKTGFFSYLQGSGTYPEIDLAYAMAYNDLGTFYPWIYYRLQNLRVDETPAFQQIYNDAKKWASYIGVNYDSMSDAVHKDTDVDDVAQCILQLAVRPGDQNKDVIQYLFRHFGLLHENALTQQQMAQTLPDKFLAISSSPSQIQRIADRYFGQTMAFSGITKSRQTGVIGRKGTYTGHYGMAAQNVQLLNPIQVDQPITVWQQQPAYIYRYQVLDSVYEEIAVFGLRINYEVHYKKGFGAGGNSPELLVPIDNDILKSMSAPRREQVICRAMYMLVNTVVVTKTPWYASSVFKAILIVVAIVVTIVSLGSAWQTIVAAAAIGTAAVLVTIFTLVLQYVVVAFAIKLFVKKFGPKVGLIAAVAAIAIGGYNAAANGSGMWADSMVSIGNGLVSESNAEYTKLIQDAANDNLQFQEWAQGQYDSLAEKRDELGLNAQWQGLSGLDFVGLVPQTVFGETPTNYYNRTVHSGNIGVGAYDLIEGFYEYKLQLPQLSDTQEIINGDFSEP